MRLILLVTMVTLSTTIGSFTNRSEHGNNYLKFVNEPSLLPQYLTESLTEAAEVYEILGNATQQNFARKFFQIDNRKMISVTQASLIVSRYSAGLLEISDNKTVDLLKSVIQGMEKMADKVYAEVEEHFNAVEIFNDTLAEALAIIGGDVNNVTYLNGVKYDVVTVKRKLYDLYFNTFVVSHVNKQSRAMIAYIHDNSSTNKQLFLDESFNTTEKIYILREAINLVKNRIDSSRFDRKTFDETWSNLTLHLFHTNVFHFFSVGLFNKDDSNVIYVQDIIINQVLDSLRNLTRSYKETTRYYYNSYFPGYIRQDIIRPVIDNIGGDNCNIAQNIVNQLDIKYPWRKYAVIVSDAVNKPDQYAHYGYPKRMLIEEDYHNKTVIIFMATKNPAKSRELYLKENGRRIVINIANSFDINDLNSVMEYANNRKKDYQMVAIKSIYNPCLPPLNTNISDAFEVKIPMEVSFPNENQVGVAVIF